MNGFKSTSETPPALGADEEDLLALDELRHPESIPFEIVTASPAMTPVLRSVVQAAGTSSTVLLAGESGTGKERVARAIHRLSPRASGPFLALDCAALPASWHESELFGLLARASRGTLYLDEVDELGPALQRRLLDALARRDRDDGGGQPMDVRLIVAVRHDPKALVRAGRLQKALLDRSSVVTIALPRLADRAGDLELLTGHFLRGFGRKYGKRFAGITDHALTLLRGHPWTGNVRELRDLLERVVVAAPGGILRAADLPAPWRPDDPARPPRAVGLPTLHELERTHIERAVARASGHLGNAARMLGIHRNTLTRKLRQIVAGVSAAERAPVVHPLDHAPFNRRRG